MKNKGALVRKQTIMENLSYQDEISNSTLDQPETNKTTIGPIKQEKSHKQTADDNSIKSESAKHKLAIYSKNSPKNI